MISGPQITINNDPSCRCEAYADCRDVSAFARADKQQRGGACPPGRVFCCANARPSAPVLVQPPNQPIPIIIPSPNPGVVVQPVPLPPNGLNIPNPAFQGCGIKGGNPLARTFDVTNPQGETEFGEYPWMVKKNWNSQPNFSCILLLLFLFRLLSSRLTSVTFAAERWLMHASFSLRLIVWLSKS